MTGREICRRFKSAGIENYRFEAEILAEELSGRSYSDETDYAGIEPAVKKREEGYPLQYIIGKWWFWDCEFIVNENCLIPRADTEILVDTTIKLLPKGAYFADLCTGSGCIAISVLRTRKDTKADAYELYKDTLKIASENAELNNVSDRISFFCGNVLDRCVPNRKVYDAIVSNPPYIRSDVLPTLDKTVGFEPKAALDGGADGLMFYRAILDNFTGNLKEDGFFAFEIGYDQAEQLKYFSEHRNMRCEIKKDLCGNDRVAVVRFEQKFV